MSYHDCRDKDYRPYDCWVCISHFTRPGDRLGRELELMHARNRNGLLVPTSTTDQELQHLRNSIPDEVKIQVRKVAAQPSSIIQAEAKRPNPNKSRRE
jgi:hypothetical protein